jgi:hypothetical protein
VVRFWVGLTVWLLMLTTARADLRINQIQFVGSHNSYKQTMSEPYRTLVKWFDDDIANALDYAHPPLGAQLDLGLRKVELDVFYQPETGEFIVGHVQLIDMNSHCLTLRQCLEQLVRWSRSHPEHEPIWISFNAKDEVIDWLPEPAPFDAAAFNALDQVLEASLDGMLIRPETVKVPGQFKPNWPRLDDARGKFLLVLDESGVKQELYLSGWRKRPMFVAVDADHAAAAVLIVNDPITEQESIRHWVRAGFLVRTRADADTMEARINDTRRRDAALASGAHAISSDYYLPSNGFSNDYRVWIEGGIRCNPISAPVTCAVEISKQ